MEEHKFAKIYDRLNNQPHLQELISAQVWKLFEIEDKEIWRDNHKHNNDLLFTEWNLFVECEMNMGFGLHGGVCSTKQDAASHIIYYVPIPGFKISPIGYDHINHYMTKTIMKLPESNRHRVMLELVEEDRLHCRH
tara:strand:+ start:606 stop:1013 length:408 start_codon:yes stop_codon:yes gene_type:complete